MQTRLVIASVLATVLASGAAVVSLASIAIAAPRLEVRGASRFDAQAAPSQGTIAVSGALLDDADRPIGMANIVATFVAEDGKPLDAAPCHPGERAPLPGRAHAAWLSTDADGTFCLRADARPGTTKVTLTWAGTRLVTGTHTDLTVDASRRAVTLKLDPDVHVLALGEGARTFEAVAKIASEDAPVAPSGLTLRLEDERGAVLGEAVTNAEGQARIVTPPNLLGPPGPGELRLTFDGDGRNASASFRSACERRVQVLVAPRQSEAAVTDGVAEGDGAAVDFDVRAATGDSVSSGSVEGLFQGAVVGLAKVQAGSAHVVMRLPEGAIASVEARYVPEVPWYVAGRPAVLSVRVHGVTLWQRTFLLVAGAVLLASFVASRSRLRAPKRRRSPPGNGAVEASEVPRVEVIASHAEPDRGWEGRVVDVHEATGVAGAMIRVERSSFEGVETLAETRTDELGAFVLAALYVLPGDRLSVHGPLHAPLTLPLPRPGVLAIAIVSRRRALLRRFVLWARKRGRPFDAAPEPTPAHVRRMAGEDGRTARWASAVEDAAFSERPVDAEAEAEVDRLGHEAVDPSEVHR